MTEQLTEQLAEHLTEQDIINKISQRQCFKATIIGGAFTLKLSAIHLQCQQQFMMAEISAQN